jgi:hypothetical protein
MFLFFYSLGMIPALWFQHEITSSLLAKYSKRDVDSKYSSDSTFKETKFFEILLYGTLFLVRTCLPRQNENWTLRSSVDLMLSDITYMTDSLDFSKILFDDTRKTMDKNYKSLVLWSLAYTSCLFCLNIVYRPARVHIKHVYWRTVSWFDQVELILTNDPFVRFLIPSLFYEIPMSIARLIIFYGYRTVNWDNFTFLLKNIIYVFLTFVAYFEIKEINTEEVFYSNKHAMV